MVMASKYHLQLFFLFFVDVNLLLLVNSQDQESHSTDQGFIFNGFKPTTTNSTANLTLGGASIVTLNGALQLTNFSHSITGYAFYSSPLHMFNTMTTTTTTPLAHSISSFSTTFVFQIVPQMEHGGMGFVFVIAPSKQLHGVPGPYLGVLGPKNDGNASNHMFMVEFNTVTGNGDHVALHTNGLLTTSLYLEPSVFYINNTKSTIPVNLESESPIQAWIEYDGALKIVNVTMAPLFVPKPSQPLMSVHLNLSDVLKDIMYVGFSSATGRKLWSNHYIVGWSFRMNGLAWPLDLSRLPSPKSIEGKHSRKKEMVGIGIGAGSSVAAILSVAVAVSGFLYYFLRRKKLRDVLEDWEVECAHRYSYKDLYVATKGFKDSEVLGFGGFGSVYKGTLPTTKEVVAIKKIFNNSKQGIREFVAEIASLGRMRHKNLVQLHGWCKHKDDLLLVYDFMPNGSLDNHIFGDQKDGTFLTWRQRFRILKGIASALLYLHEEWEQVVVHRDVKANNVLLDANMEGRLGDFGLSRLYDHGKNPTTTHIVGTLGYIAPEMSQTGKATTHCDVYSYGALLLEVACGRRPIEVGPTTTSHNIILLDCVRECWLRGCISEAADPKLKGCCVTKEIELVLNLGLVCCQRKPESRPNMRQVTRYLDGSEALPRVATMEIGYSDSDSQPSSSSNISSFGHGVMSSGSFRGAGGR